MRYGGGSIRPSYCFVLASGAGRGRRATGTGSCIGVDSSRIWCVGGVVGTESKRSWTKRSFGRGLRRGDDVVDLEQEQIHAPRSHHRRYIHVSLLRHMAHHRRLDGLTGRTASCRLDVYDRFVIVSFSPLDLSRVGLFDGSSTRSSPFLAFVGSCGSNALGIGSLQGVALLCCGLASRLVESLSKVPTRGRRSIREVGWVAP